MPKNESFGQKIKKLEKSWSQNYDFRTNFSPRLVLCFVLKGIFSDVERVISEISLTWINLISIFESLFFGVHLIFF